MRVCIYIYICIYNGCVYVSLAHARIRSQICIHIEIYIYHICHILYMYIYKKNTLCDEAGHSDAKLAAFGVPQGGSNSLDRFLIRIRGAGPKWFILGLRGSVVTSRRVANVS